MTPKWEAFHIVLGVQNSICLVPSTGSACPYSDFTMSATKTVTGKPCTRFAHIETFSPNFRQKKYFLKYNLDE